GDEERDEIPGPGLGDEPERRHRVLKYTTVNTTTHTTSTKCQYRPTLLRMRDAGRRAKSPASARPRTIARATSPTVTCRPWKPVRVKNVVAKRLRDSVTPLS